MRIPRHWRITVPHAIVAVWVLLILLAGHANAQAVRFDTVVDTTSPQCASGKICPLNVIPGAIVSVCGGSVTTLTSCLASPATTYTNSGAGTPCATTAQLTPATGGACLSTADNQGGAGFWALPGQYNYFIRVPATAGGGTYGPYPINVGASAGCPLGVTCDASYSTLAAACAAAGTGTLYVTRTWSGLTTQTFACNMIAMANGIIKPGSSQVITITGSFDGGLNKHFDTSLSVNGVKLAHTGIVWPDWFGAQATPYPIGGSPFDSGPAINAALNAAPESGDIRFSTTSAGYAWYTSVPLAQILPSQFNGLGTGDTCGTAPTCIVPAAGVTAIINTNTSRGSLVANVYIQSLSTGAGADHCIVMGNSRFHIENVVCDGFGGDQVYDFVSNVDNSSFNRLLLRNGFSDGYHCDGSGGGECNGVVGTNSEARGNAGYGFHFGSGAGGVYIKLTGVGNTLGDFYNSGSSNTFISPYCEGSGNFTEAGSDTNIQQVGFGQCTYVNVGGSYASARVCSIDAGTGAQVCNGVLIGPSNPATASPKNFGWLSMEKCSTCFSLFDVNNNTQNFWYDSATGFHFINKPIVSATITALTTGGAVNLAIETGASANNALVATLTDTNGNAIPISDGLSIYIHLAHSLRSGGLGDTLNLNGTGIAGIIGHRGPGINLVDGYAVNGIINLVYNGSIGGWMDMSQ